MEKMITVRGVGNDRTITQMTEAEFEKMQKPQSALAQSENNEQPTEDELGKMTKAELVAVAKNEGVKVVPDSMTNKVIIGAILAGREN